MQIFLIFFEVCLLMITLCGSHGFIGIDSISRLPLKGHILHTRLCPAGSGSESCFLSQLSMFIKMQDTLFDPASLRNIGKRGKPILISDSSNELKGPYTYRPIVDNRQSFQYFKNDDQTNEIYSMQQRHLNGKVTDYHTHESISNLQPEDQSYTRIFDIPNSMNDLRMREEKVKPNNLERLKDDFVVGKRQVVCPNHMSRSECYDNAFGYYLRLYKILNAP